MGFSATDAAELRPYADNVMITGVKSKPELNGKLGMIVGPFDLQSGRISVLVEGTPAAISLKPENLEGSGLPEGVVITIHPSCPSEMPQQDQNRGTVSVYWAAPAPTRSALRALDERAELAPSCGCGCCAAVRPWRFGTRMARSASPPRSGARRKFWAR